MNELQQSDGTRKFLNVTYYIGLVGTIISALLLTSLWFSPGAHNNASGNEGAGVFVIIIGFFLLISLVITAISLIFLGSNQNELEDIPKKKLVNNNIFALIIVGIITYFIYYLSNYMHGQSAIWENSIFYFMLIFIAIIIIKIYYLGKNNFHIVAIINKIMVWVLIIGASAAIIFR